MKKRIFQQPDGTIIIDTPSNRSLWAPTILKVKVKAVLVPKEFDRDGNEIELKRKYCQLNRFRHQQSAVEYQTTEETQFSYESNYDVTFEVICKKHGENVGVLEIGQMIDAQLTPNGYDNKAEVLEVISIPQESDAIENCKVPDSFEGFPFITVKESETPEIDFSDGTYQEQLYFENGECKKENLRKDLSWDLCLMPSTVVKLKHIERLAALEAAELAKESPDVVGLFRCMNERNECPKWNELTTYEKALENLDRRVNEDNEPDKPVARQRIEDKIAKLQGDVL